MTAKPYSEYTAGLSECGGTPIQPARRNGAGCRGSERLKQRESH